MTLNNSSNSYTTSNNKKMLTAFYNSSNQINNNNNSNIRNDLANSSQNEKQEIVEINNRLENYINSVKDLNDDFGQTNANKDSTLASIMVNNLEKDLTTLKQLYQNEFNQMRGEIEELSSFKNKYSLENYNLELKLKDFIVKFEDVKKTNQELLQELNQVKSKNNQIEFEMETSKLEAEKPQRENKQLKKDLQDLIEKLNQKQSISDNEIAYRQEIETKYKELSDLNMFQKKLHEQEIENLKSQLKVSHEAISSLETKLNELSQNEANLTNRFDMEYQQLQSERNALKSRNFQLEEQNQLLKTTCHSLETVISNLEEIKNSLEEKIALNNDNNNNTKSTTENIDKLDNNSIKSPRQYQQSRISFSTNLLDLNDQINPNTSIKFSEVNEYFPDDSVVDYEEENKLFTSINSKRPTSAFNNKNTSNNSSANLIQSKQSSNQYIQNHQEQQQFEKQNQQLTQMKKKELSQFDQNQQKLSFSTNNSISSPNLFVSPSSSSITSSTFKKQQTAQNQNLVIGGQINSLSYLENKDFTNDLFKNFEKNTLLNSSRLKSNSQASSIDNHVTEASYIGNVKIHEVNKNGYFIRLLNISNTIEEDLSNYSIQQVVSTMPVAVYRLPPSTKLLPGHTLTVWSRTDEVQPQPPHTYVWQEQDRWGTGPECTTILSKPNGQAISWTTGCHKYGNIDYDEIVPVYTHRRQKAQQIQLNRDKLLPQSVFMPTKHPHGQAHLKSTETIQTASSSALSSFQTTKDNNQQIVSSTSSKLIQSDSNNNFSNYSAFQKSFFSNKPTNSKATKPTIINNSSKICLGVK